MKITKEEIDGNKIPNHIAVIMDGNGRWAKERGLERVFGHRNAIRAVRDCVESAVELGVKYITLYTFSSENWNRPNVEVNALMDLLVKSLTDEIATLLENGIKFNFIGDKSKLSKSVINRLEEAREKTKKGEKAMLTLALSYGSKNEILNAVNEIINEVKTGKIREEKILEEKFSTYLYTKDMPDVDLMIRTGKEKRISNFLLWQSAYSELYFSDVLWPDFTKENMYEAILDYQKRDRRFGKVSK